MPWHEVAIDLIGPWTMKLNGTTLIFNALTCIDPVTNLVELACIENKFSAHVAMSFENEWLTRYPQPLCCIHNQGGKFIGPEFQRVL